jgi:hypothetical protein
MRPLPARLENTGWDQDSRALRSHCLHPFSPPPPWPRRSQICLQAASIGLLHHMRHPQVELVCSLMVGLDAAPDSPAAVNALLHVSG